LHQTSESIENIKDCCILHGSFFENRILVVLTQEGYLQFYNLDNGELLENSFENDNENKIHNMFCSPNSRYLCCLTQNGIIKCYDLDLLNMKLNSKSQQQNNTINNKSEIYPSKIKGEHFSKVCDFLVLIYRSFRLNIYN
jgi:hypothetical protein